MALLRHLHLSSTSSSPTPFRQSPQLISLSNSPISLSFNTQKLNLLSFCLSSTTQVEAPTAIDSDDTTKEQVVVVKEGEDSRTRLIAQNVPWSLTNEEVRSLFEKYGTVLNVELSIYSKVSNKSRGLAFITMSSHEEALTALNSLQSYEIEGRTLVVDWAKPRREKRSFPKKEKPEPNLPPVFNLFVSNLPFQARTKDLKNFFISENANIVNAVVMFKAPSGSAGYGYVSFNTQEEANAALESFQGKEFMGRPLRVERSRRFAKSRTKKAVQSGAATTLASNPKTEETEKAELASNPKTEETEKADEVEG